MSYSEDGYVLRPDLIGKLVCTICEGEAFLCDAGNCWSCSSCVDGYVTREFLNSQDAEYLSFHYDTTDATEAYVRHQTYLDNQLIQELRSLSVVSRRHTFTKRTPIVIQQVVLQLDEQQLLTSNESAGQVLPE